jgi:hypothetical protein
MKLWVLMENHGSFPMRLSMLHLDKRLKSYVDF